MTKKLVRIVASCLVCLYSMEVSGQKKPFEAYKQAIPGTDLYISMIPIPGGTFTMGSPVSEKGRSADEGPVHLVEIAPFWMQEVEVSWDL